jgi:LytS/YehU family sensor histidine kinase
MKTKKLSRNTVYWILQISGWGTYFVLNLLFLITQKEFQIFQLVKIFSISFLGLIFTHLQKKIINKYKWKNLSIQSLIPKVLLLNLAQAVSLIVIVVTIDLLINPNAIKEFKLVKITFFTLNATILFFMWSLVYFTVHFFENYKKAEIEALIFESAVKDFELKSLKSQLNPHFIFNAMNSIRALIEENPQRAKEAITKLSNIMRYTLKIERTEMVQLSEEIETIKDYLDLEKIRFEERLDYEIIIDKNSEKIEIPPMMIQTLVENGIKHGISKVTSGGKIKIETKILDGFMIINIFNPGKLWNDSLKTSNGFGVSNTKQRLNLIYGEKAILKLENIEENLVHTQLEIPLENEK